MAGHQSVIKTPYPNIIFDLDGTLTDSADGVTASISYALKKMGLKVKNEDLISFIGPPLQSSFIKICGFTEKEMLDAVTHFRDYYREKGIYINKLYPGVTKLLDNLYSNEIKIYLATSKATFFAETILKHFKIDHYFTFIAGATLDGSRVEKKEVLSYLIANNSNIHHKNAVMVGDRKHDIIGAQAFGLNSIAVTYGYGSIQELSLENPEHIVHSVPELEKVLTGI